MRMCGRVRLAMDYSEIKIPFRIPAGPAVNFHARYNGAPTHDFPVVRRNPDTAARSMDMLRWGLVPAWSKDEKIAFKTINARAETVATMPAFRGAWNGGRRGVLPLNG